MKQVNEILIHIQNPDSVGDLMEMFEGAIKFIRESVPKNISLTQSLHPCNLTKGCKQSYASTTSIDKDELVPLSSINSGGSKASKSAHCPESIKNV